MEHTTILPVTPSDPPPSQGISGGRGGDTTRKICQIEVTENSLLYCSRVTRCSTTPQTFTSCPLPWYFRKSRVDKVILNLLNHALPKFKVSPVSPEWRVEADWLKSAAPQMHFVGQPTSILSHDLRTHPARAVHLQQRLLSEGPKAGIRSEQNGRWLADANLYIYNLYEFLHKILTSQRRLFPGLNLEGALHYET